MIQLYKYIKLTILVLIGGYITCISSNSIFAQGSDMLKSSNILILSSLEPAQPAYEHIIENLKQTIRNEYNNPVNFYLDYLELSRFPDEKHLSDFFNYYDKKYSGTKFDLFISIGPGLYPFVHKFGGSIIDSLPKIFVENYDPSSYPNYEIHEINATAVFIDFGIEKKIQFALELKPDTKNIYVVTGSSDYDKKLNSLYGLALKQYEGIYNINFESGLSIKYLTKELNNLPEKSIVFLPLYQKDSSGTSYYSPEVIKLFSQYTNSPIFPLYSPQIEGTIGGLLINIDDVGIQIGKLAIRILSGEKPETINTYHSDFSKYLFNWKQLKKWGISEKNLPEGSIIINREYSFIEMYYPFFIAGIIFVIIETLLFIYILILYRKQKAQSVTIKFQEGRFKALVDFNRLSELSELTASLSHQLNQPLTAILTSSQASLRFINNNNYNKELFEEIFGNIVEDVKRASEIINSLRGLMKEETREKKKVNINKLSEDVFLLFRGEASVNDISLEREFDKRDAFINADSILIQQVILNLLLNASEELKNNKNGSKKIILKTKVEDDYIIVSVSDNGRGVADSLKNDIFKPFFTTKSNGLGIGLAICKTIIDDHEGKFQFENNESGGATFYFKLKLLNEGI